MFATCDWTVGAEVSGVSANQDYPGNVAIKYDLDSDLQSKEAVHLEISSDEGKSFNVPLIEVSGEIGEGLKSSKSKLVFWRGLEDWKGHVSHRMVFRISVVSTDWGDTSGFVKVPGGWFVMGGIQLGKRVLPTSRVYVDPFLMQATEVIFGQWKEVWEWGQENGYPDLAPGHGKGDNHPVVMIDRGDTLKWCNAASEKEGRKPCYRKNGDVYRVGSSDGILCDWEADGFRLPTEAEWERAAKCGKTRLYAWDGPADAHRANYMAWATSAEGAKHSEFWQGEAPHTAPVGSYPPNEWGLYDMVGNVQEKCWDWFSEDFLPDGLRNPTGPENGTLRSLRGGSWSDKEGWGSVVRRYSNQYKEVNNSTGFRIVTRVKGTQVVSSAEVHSKEVFDFDVGFVDGVEIPSPGRDGNVAKLWEFNASGRLLSSPAIGRDGTVYIGSDDRNLYALEPSLGAVKWTYDVGHYIHSAPAASQDGKVFVASLNPVFHALDAASGALVWKVDLGAGTRASPAIARDGTVFIHAGSTFHALANEDGKVLWTFGTGASIRGGAVVCPDGSVVFGCEDFYVYSLDGGTGELNWKFGTGDKVYASPAISQDGHVYIGSHDAHLYCLDSKSGELLWKVHAGSPVESQPVVGTDGTVYVGSNGRSLWAVDGRTGKVKWKVKGRDEVIPSPILCNGGILLYNTEGYLYALDQDGGMLWKAGGDWFGRASPTMGHSRVVYLPCLAGRLLAFQVNSLRVSGQWPLFQGNASNTGRAD